MCVVYSFSLIQFAGTNSNHIKEDDVFPTKIVYRNSTAFFLMSFIALSLYSSSVFLEIRGKQSDIYPWSILFILEEITCTLFVWTTNRYMFFSSSTWINVVVLIRGVVSLEKKCDHSYQSHKHITGRFLIVNFFWTGLLIKLIVPHQDSLFVDYR